MHNKMKRSNAGLITVRKDGLELDINADDDSDLKASDSVPVSLSKLYRDFAGTDQDCWGCKYTINEFSANSEMSELAQIWEMYVNNKGTMDDMELCKQIETLHLDLIVKPLRADGLHAMLWSADIIYRHFHYHLFLPQFEILDDAKQLKVLLHSMEGTLIYHNKDTDKHEPQHKNIDTYLKVMDAKKRAMGKKE